MRYARCCRVRFPASPLLGHCKLLNYLSSFFTPKRRGHIKTYDFPARREVRGFLQGLSQRGGRSDNPVKRTEWKQEPRTAHSTV